MKKKLALVTGGLSGMGKATVIELSRVEYDVIVFDIQDDKLDILIDECKDHDGKIFYRHCNLLDGEDIKKSFNFINNTYGNLDCAFNNAGFGIQAKPFDEVSEKEIDTLINIDIKSYMLCMIYELKMMKENGFGRIVNNSSGAGLLGSAGGALYNAVKHAVVGLTKGASLDYAKQNITINCICPGTIDTELVSGLKDIDPDMYKHAAESNPIGRMGAPSEVARVVKFLFEEDSSYLNGVIMPIDSGWSAGK